MIPIYLSQIPQISLSTSKIPLWDGNLKRRRYGSGTIPCLQQKSVNVDMGVEQSLVYNRNQSTLSWHFGVFGGSVGPCVFDDSTFRGEFQRRHTIAVYQYDTKQSHFGGGNSLYLNLTKVCFSFLFIFVISASDKKVGGLSFRTTGFQRLCTVLLYRQEQIKARWSDLYGHFRSLMSSLLPSEAHVM
jgi:hypothetical protein